MTDIIKSKTPFEQAEKAGKKILQEAKDELGKRKEYANKEIYQSAKEMGSYFCAKTRGRVSVIMDGDAWERIFGKRRRNANQYQ